MAQAVIWIPARVADAQPAGVIPDAVAGDGDAEKRVSLHNWFQRTLEFAGVSTNPSLTLSRVYFLPCQDSFCNGPGFSCLVL